jgi:hypothetical protein
VLPWESLTSCFKREIVAITYLIVLLLFFKRSPTTIFWEVLQIALILFIVQKLNSNSLEENPQCLDNKDEHFLLGIDWTFFILLYLFTGTLGLMLILGFIALVYILVEEFYFQPKSRKMRTLNETQFNEIPVIQFMKIGEQDKKNSYCTLCREPFLEQEELMRLPVCLKRLIWEILKI